MLAGSWANKINNIKILVHRMLPLKMSMSTGSEIFCRSWADKIDKIKIIVHRMRPWRMSMSTGKEAFYEEDEVNYLFCLLHPCRLS